MSQSPYQTNIQFIQNITYCNSTKALTLMHTNQTLCYALEKRATIYVVTQPKMEMRELI